MYLRSIGVPIVFDGIKGLLVLLLQVIVFYLLLWWWWWWSSDSSSFPAGRKGEIVFFMFAVVMDVARELLEFLHRDVEVVEINQLASVGDKGDIRWDVDADAAGTDADLSSGSACVVAKKYDTCFSRKNRKIMTTVISICKQIRTLASIGRWVLVLLLLPFFPIGVLVVIAGVTSK